MFEIITSKYRVVGVIRFTVPTTIYLVENTSLGTDVHRDLVVKRAPVKYIILVLFDAPLLWTIKTRDTADFIQISFKEQVLFY